METLKEILEKITFQIPVQWDRGTENKHDDGTISYVVYGWIDRKDGYRDFITIIYNNEQAPSDAYFITSSAKYSALLAEIVTGEPSNHTPCRKIADLLGIC